MGCRFRNRSPIVSDRVVVASPCSVAAPAWDQRLEGHPLRKRSTGELNPITSAVYHSGYKVSRLTTTTLGGIVIGFYPGWMHGLEKTPEGEAYRSHMNPAHSIQ